MADQTDNFNTGREEPIVVEAEPIIVGADTVFAMPSQQPADDTVFAMPPQQPEEDAVIIPMGAPAVDSVAAESAELEAQLNALLNDGPPQPEHPERADHTEEIESIERQVNEILTKDVITPEDEKRLPLLQQRLDELLNGEHAEQPQPIVTPTSETAIETPEAQAQPSQAQPVVMPTEETPKAQTQPSETDEQTPQPSAQPVEPQPTEPTTEAETAEQPTDAAQATPIVPELDDEPMRDWDGEAVRAKESLLAYLGRFAAEKKERDAQQRAEQDKQREIDALKAQVEALLRQQAAPQSEPVRDVPNADRRDDRRNRDERDGDSRRVREPRRDERRDDRDRDDYDDRRRTARRMYDGYYEDRDRREPEKPSSMLDNMFQQWFESEVQEKFRSLFDDKHDRRDPDEPKEIRPELVTVSEPESLPGLVQLGKNLYYNPADGKAYFIAPLSAMTGPVPSATKKPVRKKAVKKRPVRAAAPRPRRRAPRRSPYGRPLRRPPRRY